MTIRSLVIDGTPIDSTSSSRLRIYVNSEQIWLTQKSFGYLTKLAVARMIGDGWIHKTEIEPGGNQPRYIWRMKQECGCIEVLNDRQGHYRLDVAIKAIHFNHEQLAQFPDVSVRELFE